MAYEVYLSAREIAAELYKRGDSLAKISARLGLNQITGQRVARGESGNETVRREIARSIEIPFEKVFGPKINANKKAPAATEAISAQ